MTPIWGFPVGEFRRAAAELAPNAEVRVLPSGGTVEIWDGRR
jgi:hypothetical protein